MTPSRRNNLERLFRPRHIAFVGGRDAAVAMGEARRIGYEGQVWPINPKRETLGDVPCYRHPKDLPEPPDAVFLAIPAAPAIEMVAELREMGTGGIVCYSAGFGEAGEAGRTAERSLIEAAGDMAFVGPNCYGVINYVDRVALWPFAQGGSTTGTGAAIITQSGMLSSDLTMSQRSLPLSHMISIGNQAVLAIEDIVEFLCEDDRVRCIGIHIEGLRDVARFADVAVKAARFEKPIVVLKTGSSEIGRQLATSHTGSISGEDDLYDALFKRCGVVRVYSPSQMLETLKLMCVCGAPAGDRLVGFTCSGGGAAMLADRAEKVGLKFGTFSGAIKERLEDKLPPGATVSNPLDYTTPIWGQSEITGPVFETALEQACDATILVQDYPAPGLDESKPFYLADADAFGKAAARAGVPAIICSTLPENLDQQTRLDLITRNIAPMQGINETLDAVSAAVRWEKMRSGIAEAMPGSLHHPDPVANPVALSEAEAKAMLADAGFPVPTGRACGEDTLVEAAEAIGFPVALKLCHRDLLHKTELGAVQLGLDSTSEVRAAASDMLDQVRAVRPNSNYERFLVEKMAAKPIAELLVSVRRDDQFGLAMTIGGGGVLVELMRDAITVLLPATRAELVDAIGQLKSAQLLNGFRGNPRAELKTLADMLLRLGEIVRDGDNICELEINPLFVYETSVCAVDALIYTGGRG